MIGGQAGEFVNRLCGKKTRTNAKAEIKGVSPMAGDGSFDSRWFGIDVFLFILFLVCYSAFWF